MRAGELKYEQYYKLKNELEELEVIAECLSQEAETSNVISFVNRHVIKSNPDNTSWNAYKIDLCYVINARSLDNYYEIIELSKEENPEYYL